MRARAPYIALALLTIATGLIVHRGGLGLGPVARDVLGDALWAMMIVWWAGALAPRAPPWVRGGAALVLCYLVELSQAIHTPGLDALRRTIPGQLVLGSGFDPRDFLAYTAGVVAAVVLSMLVNARTARTRA